MSRLAVIAGDVAGVAGGLLLAVGVGMIYPPAGVIVGGLLLIGGALLQARAG